MTTPYLLADLRSDEGLRLNAYPDPISHGAPWTIGYGHTGSDVHPGVAWTDAQAEDALVRDVAAVQQGLDTCLSWWRSLNDARQDVLVNMGYELGVHGLLGFPETLADIKAGVWPTADHDMLASRWASQVPGRAARLAIQMLTGVRATT